MKGLVTARFRRHVRVRDDEGIEHQCLVLGRKLSPLPGDTVEYDTTDDGHVITAIEPRTSVLTRIDAQGRPEAIASNVSQLIVVAAPQPEPDLFLVDRFLAAAELLGIAALILWNKSDIARLADTHALRAREAAGYRIIECSTRLPGGADELRPLLGGQRSVLVGQSGVGKSSLVNELSGSSVQATRSISTTSGHGRHTTTTAVLHELPGGGELIDSPGVRHYAPYIEERSDLDRGFREFTHLLGQCRFSNCAHDREPDCAIKEAVATGEIAAGRYESYLRLRERLNSL